MILLYSTFSKRLALRSERMPPFLSFALEGQLQAEKTIIVCLPRLIKKLKSVFCLFTSLNWHKMVADQMQQTSWNQHKFKLNQFKCHFKPTTLTGPCVLVNPTTSFLIGFNWVSDWSAYNWVLTGSSSWFRCTDQLPYWNQLANW